MQLLYVPINVSTFSTGKPVSRVQRVNASLPLDAIRDTNIKGTKTVIELCIAAKAFLHYISSASVLSGSGVTRETFHVPPPGKYSTAYAKSKWVGEQLVGKGVTELGLCARIYRLGSMGCHSITGACNPNDSFTRIIKGIISLGAYADDGDLLPRGFFLAPIDWAIESLCCIVASKSSDEINDSGNQYQKQSKKKMKDEIVPVVHILTNEPLSISVIFHAIKKYNIPLIRLQSNVFKDKINAMDKGNAMYTFRDVFQTERCHTSDTSKKICTKKVDKFSRACPNVNANVILNMLKYMYEENSFFAGDKLE